MPAGVFTIVVARHYGGQPLHAAGTCSAHAPCWEFHDPAFDPPRPGMGGAADGAAGGGRSCAHRPRLLRFRAMKRFLALSSPCSPRPPVFRRLNCCPSSSRWQRRSNPSQVTVVRISGRRGARTARPSSAARTAGARFSRVKRRRELHIFVITVCGTARTAGRSWKRTEWARRKICNSSSDSELRSGKGEGRMSFVPRPARRPGFRPPGFSKRRPAPLRHELRRAALPARCSSSSGTRPMAKWEH